MRRTTVNFLVDLIAFVNLLLPAATDAIMRWVLPPGPAEVFSMLGNTGLAGNTRVR